jgi:phosphonate transport system substrate-binding protein
MGMKNYLRRIVPVVLWMGGFLVLFLPACRNKMAVNSEGIPENTLLVAVYGSDDPARMHHALKLIGDYLGRKTGLKVEFILTTDYTGVIEALRTKKVHMAYLSPFSYVLATQRNKLVPLVTVGNNGHPTVYRSVIFTSTKSGLKTMDDVKARAKSLTICFADPASTSGHLIPRAYLTTIGLDPQVAFKEILFAASHTASVLTVQSGKVDLGCTTKEYGIDLSVKRGIIKREDLVILWTSDPIEASPIVMRQDINAAFTEKIRQAYLTMRTEDPQAFMEYIKTFRANADSLSYIPVQDSSYNGIRKIAAGIKDLNLMK